MVPSEEKQEQTSKKFKKPTQTGVDDFTKFIIREETDINEELFNNCFSFRKPAVMLKNLYDFNNKDKSKQLVNVSKSGLIDFKNETKKMSEEVNKTKKPHKIVNIFEKILKFNEQKQLHSTKPELRFCAGLNLARGVLEIRDGEDL